MEITHEMIEHVCKRASWFSADIPYERNQPPSWGIDRNGMPVDYRERDFHKGRPRLAVLRAAMEIFPHDERFGPGVYYEDQVRATGFRDLVENTSCFLATCLFVAPNRMWSAYLQKIISYDEMHDMMFSVGCGYLNEPLRRWMARN